MALVSDARVSSSPIRAHVSRLLGPRHLVFEEEAIDPGSLATGEIAIATEFSAISPGTELAAYSGLAPLRPGPVYPRLVGYCNCGRVLGVGRNVTRVRAGDRVLTNAAHRSHYRTSEVDILALVPADLDGACAAVAYLFHLGYAALLSAKVKAGQRVAVIGLGALGMTSVAMARAAGARVVAVSHRDRALAQARCFGADETRRIDDPGNTEADADVVITTSNDWDDWLLALRAARRGGTIAVLGFPGRGQPPASFNPLDSQYFYDKQLTVMAVGQTGDAELARNMAHLLELIAAEKLPALALARDVRPAGELQAAYEDLLRRPDDVLTYVLQW